MSHFHELATNGQAGITKPAKSGHTERRSTEGTGFKVSRQSELKVDYASSVTRSGKSL